ncbi:hypothetical protein PHYSODRAFT_300584 [Phytophthora sojae]|uniref:Uncharacterized protein n=1 Tax=Phytophthora sojae (strain P6497) TaxID=1094619 RepID=G4ZG64_PHYSP|nr:hypothetical protein PHYSODRAFT_300584 [Phytophthora sojae]EGZ17548.1 hypothetical protein PHYSODRAFT_300584 [Phytophthora sojae]|eukprot:XP_009526606.1 hypothetical protein PHYSODRAFT_300584 [Phytophthora sojae]
MTENAKFWSELWPEDPEYERHQPPWAAQWKHLRLRGLPVPSTDRLKFLFRVWDGEVGGRNHADVLALVEGIIADSKESESAGFRLTMEILARHIEQDRWSLLQVECAVETTQEHANRWGRLTNAAKQAEVTKMWIPFHFTECFLSAQHCLGRSGVLRDAAAVFQVQGGDVPVTELMLHFGWDSAERNLDKRLREFKALLWNASSANEHALRMLQITGRCLTDAAFFGTLCSAFPFIGSLQDLRVVLPPAVRSDRRTLLWIWLALSIFHPESGSKLQHLDLSQLDVSAEDVKLVCGIKKRRWSSVAFELLMGSPGLQNSSLPTRGVTMALVKSYTRVEPEPIRRLFTKPLVTLKKDEEFVVLSLEEDWVCVWLPGFGRGFVKRQSVVSISTRSSVLPSGESGITSLKLKTVDISATLALLRVIGGHLERLTLNCEAFTNAHFNELLECCPHLTQLSLRSGKLDDFSTLMEASVAGTCKVSSLHISSRNVTTSSLECLAKMLSSPSLASASRLRELYLQTGRLQRTDLEILLGLLKSNRTLSCLHIKLAFNLFDEYMPRFLAHRGDWLRGGKEARKKLAFISAMDSPALEDSAMQRTDAVMLSKIFEFACDGERRILLDEYTDGMTLQEIVARVDAAER